MSEVTLYDYWRSSASYRVRIALNLAGIEYKTVVVNLLDKEHRSDAHLERNPQGFVPVLEIDGHSFTQSLSILDYLDETRVLGFLPQEAALRAKVRSLAHSVAVDVHPVCNLGVVGHVMQLTEGREGVREEWMQHFIRKGLVAFEELLSEFEQSPFVNGEKPGLAEICMMPQLYNAERWKVDYSDCSQIVKLRDACSKNQSFIKAHPDAVNF